MSIEVIGIDHVFFAVTDMRRSEAFYDQVMTELGFKKNAFANENERHVQYFNRHFGIVLRPAEHRKHGHEPLAPGLHHFCFRVADTDTVDEIARRFTRLGIECSQPALYPEYAPDYYALFFSDPDGIRLEVTNFRQERKHRFHNWPNI